MDTDLDPGLRARILDKDNWTRRDLESVLPGTAIVTLLVCAILVFYLILSPVVGPIVAGLAKLAAVR